MGVWHWVEDPHSLREATGAAEPVKGGPDAPIPQCHRGNAFIEIKTDVPQTIQHLKISCVHPKDRSPPEMKNGVVDDIIMTSLVVAVRKKTLSKRKGQ